jgi:hypothetical protein
MTVDRQVSWFDSPSRAERMDRLARGAPSPVLLSIDVDEAGRLWVLTSVPDPRWESAVRTTSEQRFPQVVDPVRHTNSVLEVLDPATGRVIMSTTYDAPKLALIPGQWLVEPAEDAQGRPVIRLMNLHLTGG